MEPIRRSAVVPNMWTDPDFLTMPCEPQALYHQLYLFAEAGGRLYDPDAAIARVRSAREAYDALIDRGFVDEFDGFDVIADFPAINDADPDTMARGAGGGAANAEV